MRTFLCSGFVLILYSGIPKNNTKNKIHKSVLGASVYNNLDAKPLKLSTYHSCSADLGLS